MKKLLTLALCILMLFAATAPAYADVDMSWWLYIPGATAPGKTTATPAPTPAPTAKPKTSSSCSMCDGTGYTALKTGTGEYVAVPCPQCSNGGGTTTTTNNTKSSVTNPTASFEELVGMFIDYCQRRSADHDISYVFTVRDSDTEEYMFNNLSKTENWSHYRRYTDRAEDMTLAFTSIGNSGTVDKISVDCSNPKNMETIVLTALFMVEVTGQLTDDCVDWMWETAANMLAKKGDDRCFYTLDENTIRFTRISNNARAEYPYTYTISIY